MDPTLLADYQSAISANSKSAKVSYQKFCARRRELIVQRLLEWEQEQRDAGPAPIEDLVPAARLIRPVPPDIIRSLGYPASVTTCLVDLCGRNEVSVVTRKDDRLSIVSRKKTEGRSSRQLLRVDLGRSGEKLGLKISDDELLADFRSRFPGIPLDNRKGKRQEEHARASFADKKKNRLLVDCRRSPDGSYTVKVIHKTALPGGGKSTRQGMISHFTTWSEARAKFDETVDMAVAAKWGPSAKGTARKCELSREDEMTEALQWVLDRLPSDDKAG
jgi:hypothetical protein